MPPHDATVCLKTHIKRFLLPQVLIIWICLILDIGSVLCYALYVRTTAITLLCLLRNFVSAF